MHPDSPAPMTEAELIARAQARCDRILSRPVVVVDAPPPPKREASKPVARATAR